MGVGYDSRILSQVGEGRLCFCKGNYVEMMVIGKTGVVAIVTAEINTEPHVLPQ